MVDRRQELEVVACLVEDLHEQVEMDRRHLRTEDRIALIEHLLRELGAREFRRSALGCFGRCKRIRLLGRLGFIERCLSERTSSLPFGLARLFRQARIDISLDRIDIERCHRTGRSMRVLFGQLISLILERSEQRTDADTRRT